MTSLPLPSLVLSAYLAIGASSTFSQTCPGDDPFVGNSQPGGVGVPLIPGQTVEYPNLAVTPSQPRDVFNFSLDTGQVVTVGALFNHDTADIDLEIRDSGLAIVAASSSTTDDEEIVFTAPSSGSYLLYVVNRTAVICNDYDLSFALAACPTDDIYENFDSCEAALGIGAATGTFASLAVKPTDPDFFEFFVPAGHTLFAETLFSHAQGDVNLEIREFSGSCGPLLGVSSSATDDESISYTNLSSTQQFIVLGVTRAPGGPGCTEYTLNWSVDAEPCAQSDGFEPNNSVCSATGFSQVAGTLPGLTVTATNPDFYDLGIIPGNRPIAVTADFSHVDGNVNMRLYDITNGCSPIWAVVIDESSGTSDRETLTFRSVVPVRLAVEVYLGPGSACNTYDMTVQNGDIGTKACDGAINSTGGEGLTRATGSPFVADNDVTLRAEGVPGNQFGFFVVGQAFQIQPMVGGFAGTLCIGTPVGRLDGPGQVVLTSPGGEASLGIDLTRIPQAGPLVPVLPGQTWYFQFWHRDFSVGATANFAAATQVRFI